MVYGPAIWRAAATPSSTRDMPLERHDPQRRRDPLRKLPGLVLPAINRLIDLGIADPQRLGVMGNSFGSYCALALLTQTDRFQAAAISAVYANLTSVYGALRRARA